jgi:protein-S-isoprenylcysteine O-methyltransferase Ste14
VPLGFVFAALYIWLARPTELAMIVGGCIALIGLSVRALASGHLNKNQALAISGPYAYTRNPLYLGSIILACGFIVAARSWWILLIAVVIFITIYRPVIRSEEDYLRSRFPEYQDYARQVPRFWPRLPPYPSSGGVFSWDLYWKHREYNAALGTAAMIAILAAKMIWRR